MWICEISDLAKARKRNEEKILVDLDEDLDLFGLADAVKSLYHNQTSPTGLCAVVFSGEEDHLNAYGEWDIKALRELMDVISKIPTVSYLGFQGIHRQNRVPLELLSSLFQQMKYQIDSLEFNSVTLIGEQEQVKEFVQALRSMPGLKSYGSLDMSIFPARAGPLDLDSIFTTISKRPMMREVEIEESSALICGSENIWRQGISSIKTLQCMLSSNQISSLSLSIGKLDLDPQGLEDLSQAIGTNRSITKLGLYFMYPDATPRTERKKDDVAMTKTPALFLAKALQINTTLEEVSIKVHHDKHSPEYEVFLLEMANAIENNPGSSVRKLIIDGATFPPDAMDAFTKLLKTSYTLEALEYVVQNRPSPSDGCSWMVGGKQTTIDFYLGLNARGRKGIMGKASEKIPRAKFVSTLASVSNDLDALYYYLRLNPCLCLDEANHSFQGRARKRSRPSSPQNLSKDDEIQRLKKELGESQKELREAQEENKRLMRLLDDRNNTSKDDELQRLKEENKRLQRLHEDKNTGV